MTIFFERTEKQAYGSLFDAAPFQFPTWAAGTVVPLECCIVDRLVNGNSNNQIFAPIDASGYAIKAALGNGYVQPIAGTFFLQSGIARTSGTLTSGKRYKIATFVAGDVFTNVGAASNATGIVFTATGTTPTTWTHSSVLQEVTANLAFDAAASAIQTALNNCKFISDAGNVVVTDEGSGLFVITWNTAGAQTELGGDATNLAPQSIIDPSTLVDGTTQLAEVQAFRLIQNPGAYKLLDSASDAAAITISTPQAGSGSANEIQRITISGNAYDGTILLTFPVFTRSVTGIVAGVVTCSAAHNLSLNQPFQFSAVTGGSGGIAANTTYYVKTTPTSTTFTYAATAGGTALTGHAATSGTLTTIAATTEPIEWNATATDVQSALEALANIGSGQITVTGEFPAWDVTFKGVLALLNVPALTGSAAALMVPLGRKGDLDLRTTALDLILDGESSQSIKFEVRATPPAGTEDYIFQGTNSLIASIIPPLSQSVTPIPGFALLTFSSKQVFVDSVYGSDTTGTRERADRPFATIPAAQAAASVGDTIIIGNGSHDLGETVASPLNISGLNLQLDARAVLSPDGMDTPQSGLVISTASRTTTISGGTLTADFAIQISANNSTLRVMGMEISGTQDVITFDGGVTGSNVVFADCHLTAGDLADFIGNFASGTLEFNNCRFTSNSTEGQDGIFIGGGTLIVNGGTITNGGGLISVSGGSAVLRGVDFTSHSSGNGVVQTGGTLRMVGCRVNTSANSGVSPVSKAGGTTLILDDCTLIAHASADSITAGSAQNVKVYGTSVSNKAKNANITIQVGTLTVDTNVA